MQELNLPVPPATVARAIEIAADPNCDITELTHVVRLSPVLAAQLIKAVNSPYYGLRRKISTVDRAISFMGIRAARNILLCFSVQDLTPKKSAYPMEKFWEGSIRRAIAAVTLAKYKGTRAPDNIMTLGLCQDLGLLVAVSRDEAAAEKLATVVDRSAPVRLAFEESLGISHVDIGAALFEAWRFPEEITDAVRGHHHPETAPEHCREAAHIANAAETMADLMRVEDKQDCLTSVTEVIEQLGIDPGMLSEIVNEISTEVHKAAEMLHIKVGTQPTYQDIMKAASKGLMALNMSYETLTAELQEALSRQEEMAKRLEELNAELEHQAMTDKLTGLPNRRAFDEHLAKETSRVERIKEPCALLLLDVDHFKRFNDTHGHQAGDLVLEAVGRTIAHQVRTCDLPARYGGEEFAVIMPHTLPEGAKIAAERIRRALEAMEVVSDGTRLSVTVSIGGTIITNASDKRAGILALRRADDALYEAKAAGRNCVQII